MKRVTGIGGIFFKARDPEALRAWYREHLGLEIEDWGGMTFRWHQPEAPDPDGATVWTIFPASSKYFDPSSAPFMINYRVPDLVALLDELRSEGCQVDDRTEISEYGKFGWLMDPEGNRIELWEPPSGRVPA
jgi:catechol 2,3-dioxygenase-like lactoylglutathione lyase family enzyme